MKYTLNIRNEIYDLIRHSPPNLKRNIRQALDMISASPNAGKQLQDSLKGFQSFRVGRFRIVYQKQSDAIQIISIGPRETIYQQLTLELKQSKT